jgi:hypothetical protein
MLLSPLPESNHSEKVKALKGAVNVTEDRRITEFDFGNLKRRVTYLSDPFPVS